MKKTIITLLAALLLLPATVSAQYKLVVKYNNAALFEKDVWDVDSITFEPITPKSLEGIAAPGIIDLGLSVNWADRNLGAISPKDKATDWLVGWGDVTAKNVSTNLKWYPVENMTNDNISDGDYDIARQMLGAPWRLPTDEELQELIDGCTWTFVNDADNDSVGFVGVSRTNAGQHIFLPASGHRVATSNEEGTYYWSGTLNADNSERANALKLTDGNAVTLTVDAVKRYVGCAIRPVNGELNINVGITASEAYALNTTTATIDVQLDGAYASYSSLEYGVYYSTNADLNVETGRQSMSTTMVSADGKHTFVLEGLDPYTTYYYTPYVIVRGKTACPENGMNFCTFRYPVPEIVDMGLSVKWASFNVGATALKEIGNYIGWGDPTGAMTSTRSDDYARGNTSTYIGGNKDYDVAQASWGDKWRMPKQSEFEELFNANNCTVVLNGLEGYFAITSKITGETIILPTGGAISFHTPNEVSWTDYAFYWTAETNTAGTLPKYGLFSDPTTKEFDYLSKANRMPIRAVYQEASSVTPTQPDQPTQPDEPDTPVTPEDPAVVGTAVDLGLSVEWADRNVGATSAFGAGYYFAWGETEVKERCDMDNYAYSDSNGKNGYTYLGTGTDTSSSYSISGTQYDAARTIWGGTWRMPTHIEMRELIENCTWVSTTEGGASGYRITGPSGKSIFLPALGWKSGSDVYYAGSYGYYWTGQIESLLPQTFNTKAIRLDFTKENKDLDGFDRYFGLPIRPVKAK